MSKGLRNITIKKARENLAEDALGLTDDEVQEIIDWLDKMADIAIEAVEKGESLKHKKIIHFSIVS